MFCDNCGKILQISNEEEKIIGKCNCGFTKIIEVSSEEKSRKIEAKGKGAIDDKNILATFPHQCKNCGHDKAEVIELGVWYSDEAGNVLYKCGKCGKTEQEKGNNS